MEQSHMISQLREQGFQATAPKSYFCTTPSVFMCVSVFSSQTTPRTPEGGLISSPLPLALACFLRSSCCPTAPCPIPNRLSPLHTPCRPLSLCAPRPCRVGGLFMLQTWGLLTITQVVTGGWLGWGERLKARESGRGKMESAATVWL